MSLLLTFSSKLIHVLHKRDMRSEVPNHKQVAKLWVVKKNKKKRQSQTETEKELELNGISRRDFCSSVLTKYITISPCLSMETARMGQHSITGIPPQLHHNNPAPCRSSAACGVGARTSAEPTTILTDITGPSASCGKCQVMKSGQNTAARG